MFPAHGRAVCADLWNSGGTACCNNNNACMHFVLQHKCIQQRCHKIWSDCGLKRKKIWSWLPKSGKNVHSNLEPVCIIACLQWINSVQILRDVEVSVHLFLSDCSDCMSSYYFAGDFMELDDTFASRDVAHTCSLKFVLSALLLIMWHHVSKIVEWSWEKNTSYLMLCLSFWVCTHDYNQAHAHAREVAFKSTKSWQN